MNISPPPKRLITPDGGHQKDRTPAQAPDKSTAESPVRPLMPKIPKGQEAPTANLEGMPRRLEPPLRTAGRIPDIYRPTKPQVAGVMEYCLAQMYNHPDFPPSDKPPPEIALLLSNTKETYEYDTNCTYIDAFILYFLKKTTPHVLLRSPLSSSVYPTPIQNLVCDITISLKTQWVSLWKGDRNTMTTHSSGSD